MTTDNLSTLKIYKLTERQYKRRLEAGEIDENAFYFTDDNSSDGALVYNVVGKGQMAKQAVWYHICYGNGMFVAVSGEEGSGSAAYSTDGVNWTLGNGIKSNFAWKSVCYGDDKFVAVGADDHLVYSYDGINWTKVDSIPYAENGYYVTVCYGDGKFVVAADEENYVLHSTDGINWETAELPIGCTKPHICYGGGKFVIVNSYFNIPAFVSTDGINWEAHDMPFDTKWDTVCYGNGKFVAGDFDGSGVCGAIYSTDGINWEYSNGLSPDGCWRVFYANDKFIALCSAGNYKVYEIAISYDGINWATATTFEEPIPLRSVCYGDGKYVAVGESDEALISLDGINWSVKNYISQNGKDVTEELREVLGGGGAGSVENAGRKVIHVNTDRSITIEIDGVMHEFDWKLITDIFDKNEVAFVVSHHSVLTLNGDKTEMIYYPTYRTSIKAYFGSPHAAGSPFQHFHLVITNLGRVEFKISNFALRDDIPVFAENLSLTAANQKKTPSAYLVGKEIAYIKPKIMDFYWRSDIITRAGDTVSGYVTDWAEEDILDWLNDGIPMIGWFHSEDDEFLFAEPAQLQSGRYTSNSNASLEINFPLSGLSHAVGDDHAINDGSDGIIVWEK